MSRALVWAAGIALMLVLVELAAARGPHPPGAAALAGALGCVAIVLVSKALGAAWLQRPEDEDE